ncbi:MAG: WG repeat-containing protein [Erysipelotrichaceae bacterium]|nr:WG repeat-containing protein [Erysipelotrichaceae bacterium]
MDKAFEEVSFFCNGYCPFRSRENRWGYINTKGEICIPDLYLFALNFNDIGIAPVEMEEGEWKIIRKDGSDYSEKTYRMVLDVDDEYIICEDHEGNRIKIDLDGEHEYSYSETDEDDYSELDEDDE